VLLKQAKSLYPNRPDIDAIMFYDDEDEFGNAARVYSDDFEDAARRLNPDISSREVHRPRESEMILLRQRVARFRCGVRCRQSVAQDSSNSKGSMVVAWWRHLTAER
jgi:hypothetical protein